MQKKETHLKPYLKLIAEGEDRLYRHAVGKGIQRFAEGIKHPEIELLDLAESCFSLFRVHGEEEYFMLGKALRRAAHTLYRKLSSKQKRIKVQRFLRLVN